MNKENQVKCCGSCEYFMNEDAEGYGLCILYCIDTRCSSRCSKFMGRATDNEDIHITPDNGARPE